MSNRPTPFHDGYRAIPVSTLDSCELPPSLRNRVLRAHARRRTARRAAPFVAVFALMCGVLAIESGDGDALQAWQSRSVALEAEWQVDADRDWLLADARAQPLLYRLRQLDSAIARHEPADAPDSDSLAQLWRQRSETLSALIDSRRQGGVAIQL
jgi:hypothetical protein